MGVGALEELMFLIDSGNHVTECGSGLTWRCILGHDLAQFAAFNSAYNRLHPVVHAPQGWTRDSACTEDWTRDSAETGIADTSHSITSGPVETVSRGWTWSTPRMDLDSLKSNVQERNARQQALRGAPSVVSPEHFTSLCTKHREAPSPNVSTSGGRARALGDSQISREMNRLEKSRTELLASKSPPNPMLTAQLQDHSGSPTALEVQLQRARLRTTELRLGCQLQTTTGAIDAALHKQRLVVHAAEQAYQMSKGQTPEPLLN